MPFKDSKRVRKTSAVIRFIDVQIRIPSFTFQLFQEVAHPMMHESNIHTNLHAQS
jgi:hypothetical protein